MHELPFVASLVLADFYKSVELDRRLDPSKNGAFRTGPTYNPSVNRGIVKPGKPMISKESFTGVADPQEMKRSRFL